MSLIEETLPSIIDERVVRELKVRLAEKKKEQDGVTAELMISTDNLRSEVVALRKEVETEQERRLREKEITVNRIIRSWKYSTATRAFNAWKQAVLIARAMVRLARNTGHRSVI